MKVCELFEAEKITDEFLDNIAGESTYWASAEAFVSQNWNMPIEKLSEKQGAWLTKILDDCVEKRIEAQDMASNLKFDL